MASERFRSPFNGEDADPISIRVPHLGHVLVLAARVVGLKFVEEQPQILRLTTPELKGVRGPVRSE